jgi:hypothetical protein
MKKIFKYLSVIALGLLFTSGIFAQTGQTVYYMNLPQRMDLNPAFTPGNRVYVQLPLISGINLSVGNNFFSLSDILMKSPYNDSIITVFHPDADITDFLSEIRTANNIEVRTKLQLLGIGFALGQKNFFSIDINTNVNAYGAFPGDFVRLAVEGNEQFVGSSMDFSSLGISANMYSEIGVGFSRAITDKLRVGVKGKVLLGTASVSTNIKSLGIDVSEDYTHTINADMSVLSSGPIAVATDLENMIDSVYMRDMQLESFSEIYNYVMEGGNVGLGLDLGAQYDLTDRIKLSASITDIGYIRWKREATNVDIKGEFTFDGFDVSDVISGSMSMDSVLGNMLDSLQASMNITTTESPFTTYLPNNINIGGSFDVTNFFTVGALSTTRFVGGRVKQALTLSANLNYRNLLTTSVAYTMANSSYSNLGIGLGLRLGIGQFYLITDHIPTTFNQLTWTESESGELRSVKVPSNWNMFNMRLGFNLVFGNKPRAEN